MRIIAQKVAGNVKMLFIMHWFHNDIHYGWVVSSACHEFLTIYLERCGWEFFDLFWENLLDIQLTQYWALWIFQPSTKTLLIIFYIIHVELQFWKSLITMCGMIMRWNQNTIKMCFQGAQQVKDLNYSLESKKMGCYLAVPTFWKFSI